MEEEDSKPFTDLYSAVKCHKHVPPIKLPRKSGNYFSASFLFVCFVCKYWCKEPEWKRKYNTISKNIVISLEPTYFHDDTSLLPAFSIQAGNWINCAEDLQKV